MNAELLLTHYERIADAPDAVARLRGFILNLAVRGKLVPHVASDEPASELLKRIAQEKARLMKAGEFREPSSFVRIERKALPFEPASHWGWARLIEIARPSYGFAFASGLFNASKRGMPLIRIRDISGTDTEAYFEGDYDPSYLVTSGDYLVGMDGDFNLRRWAGRDGLLNQRVMRINTWRCGIDPEFVKLPLQFILDHLHGQTSLTTVKHLSAKQVNGIEIPLPPLAEQHRIVAKVDELMALCDQLEAARAERESVRDRLAAASLARLNTPDAETLQADATFALENLTVLTTRPDQIKKLRQTILNLAVRGKLVPQDPSDEPASELLKRITEKKDKLLHQRGIRPDHSLPRVSADEEPFPVPRGWQWERAQELSLKISDGVHKKPSYVPAGIPFITVKNLTEGNGISFRDTKFISERDHLEFIKRTHPEKGDLLITKDGTIGVTRIVQDDRVFSVFVSVALVKMVHAAIAPFLALCINSDAIRDTIIPKGAALKHLHLVDLRKLPLPIPPLAEQHRIVAKVDALMGLCDQLEVGLDHAVASRRRLIDALLAEVLSPNAKALEAA